MVNGLHLEDKIIWRIRINRLDFSSAGFFILCSGGPACRQAGLPTAGRESYWGGSLPAVGRPHAIIIIVHSDIYNL